jgi:phosphate transport system protein
LKVNYKKGEEMCQENDAGRAHRNEFRENSSLFHPFFTKGGHPVSATAEPGDPGFRGFQRKKGFRLLPSRAEYPKMAGEDPMERVFDEELKFLKERLLRMAAYVEDALSLAIEALKDQKEEPAREVLKNEENINLLDVEVDEICMRLLALRQPMAGDLRFITSAMKISSDLERMGDLAVNVAEQALELAKLPLLKPLIDIPRMARLAQAMVRDSINAFINRDEDLARDVCVRDDEVDALDDQIFRELLTFMMEDPHTVQRAVALILVSRNLERLADHATNIGEDVIYMVKGKTIKHHMEQKKRASFPPEMGT